MQGEIQHWKWHPPLTPTEFQITNFRIVVEQTFDKGAEWHEHSVNSKNYQGNDFWGLGLKLFEKQNLEN